ncbi:MAG: hypothetical protein HW377_1089 [Actinobacteria bacterium]|nr:hypothetical protein [Actinomycetota bacterium]MBM2828791.1 hypothetical protein [Actinomycetota bacterium]
MKSPRGTGSVPGDVSTTLSVRVIPRSSRNEVAGFSEGTVRIRLTAPPVENRANEALVRFLSRVLDVPRGRVEIVAGGTGRRKIVRVAGAAREDVFRRLGLS